jgi:hypothetical protein
LRTHRLDAIAPIASISVLVDGLRKAGMSEGEAI